MHTNRKLTSELGDSCFMKAALVPRGMEREASSRLQNICACSALVSSCGCDKNTLRKNNRAEKGSFGSQLQVMVHDCKGTKAAT